MMFETPCLLQRISFLILHATKRMIYKDLWQSQGVPKIGVLRSEIAADYIPKAVIKN